MALWTTFSFPDSGPDSDIEEPLFQFDVRGVLGVGTSLPRAPTTPTPTQNMQVGERLRVFGRGSHDNAADGNCF